MAKRRRRACTEQPVTSCIWSKELNSQPSNDSRRVTARRPISVRYTILSKLSEVKRFSVGAPIFRRFRGRKPKRRGCEGYDLLGNFVLGDHASHALCAQSARRPGFESLCSSPSPASLCVDLERSCARSYNILDSGKFGRTDFARISLHSSVG